MRRVAVITSASGNGGTTFARTLAGRLGVPFVELDALNHGPEWSEATAEELRARVQPIVSSDAWVIDGSYWGKLGDLVYDRTEIIVWLDLPVRIWLPRLLRRTFGRVVRKEELWHGNRETFPAAFLGRNALIPWTLRHYRRRRRIYPARLARFNVIRLRSNDDVERFLRDL